MTTDSLKAQIRAELAQAEAEVAKLQKMLALADGDDAEDAAAAQKARKEKGRLPWEAIRPAPSAPKKSRAAARGAQAAPRPRPAEKSTPKKATTLGKTAKLPLTVESVVAVLSGAPDGLRAEKLRALMGQPDDARRRLTRVLMAGVKAKTLSFEGQRRDRKYFVRSANA